jgi:hypothetical protein
MAKAPGNKGSLIKCPWIILSAPIF